MTARTAGLLVALVVVGLASVALGRLGEPIVDGRLHWYIDDATFLRKALHSNDGAIDSPLKLFGLATYEYDDLGRPARLEHYHHHPVLSPMLFRLHARVFGYSEAAARGFSLVISLTTVGAMFLLLKTTLGHPGLCAAFTVLYALLPLKVLFMDRWKYENLTDLALLVVCALALRAGRTPWASRVLPAAMFLLMQADFPAYLFAGVVLVAMHVEARRGGDAVAAVRLLRRAGAGAVAGAVASFSIQYAMGFDMAVIRDLILYRVNYGLEHVSWGAWLSRQALFCRTQFGALNSWAGLGLLLYAAGRPRRVFTEPLAVLGAGILLGNLAWVATFRNHSMEHHYVQWYFGTGGILLAAGLARPWQRQIAAALSRRSLAAALLVPLFAETLASGWSRHQSVRRDVFGVPEDILVLRSLTRRVVYFDDGLSGPPGWWGSQVTLWHTDPLRRGSFPAGLRRWDPAHGVAGDSEAVVVYRAAAALKDFEAVRRVHPALARLNPLWASPNFVYFSGEPSGHEGVPAPRPR